MIAGVAASASEISFDFSKTAKGQIPDGFKPLLAGEGRPGKWEIIMAEVPPLLAPLSPEAPQTAVKPVLVQADHDSTDERFPMLVFEPEEFGDFVFTTRLRILGGHKEQMGGMVFRLQDSANFYVVRLSALGANLRFYKVVGGLRGQLIGPTFPIQTNVWYNLTVRCDGNQILCELDGKLVMSPLQDSSFGRGKIGFWTKSDSVCQFAGATLTYTPLVPLSTQVVQAALSKYSRVVDLQLYTLGRDGRTPSVVACKNPGDIGSPGGEAEQGAIRHGDIYVGKDKKTVTVVLPVRDRNGDPVAAARVEMERFPGQTENSAIVRAKPIVSLMEDQIGTSRDPFK